MTDAELIEAVAHVMETETTYWKEESYRTCAEKVVGMVREVKATPTHWRVVVRDTGNIGPLKHRAARNVSTQLQGLFYKHYPNSHGGYAAIMERTAIFDNDLQARRQASMCRNLGAEGTLTPMSLVEVAE